MQDVRRYWLAVGVALVSLVVLAGAAPSGAAPSNDDFANAVVLAAAGGSLTAENNTGATKQAREPNHAGDAGGASIWYRWTPSFTGLASVDTSGSSIDTLLASYVSGDITSIHLAASDDDATSSTQTSRICFPVTPNTEFHIAVDGYAGESGPITLHWGPQTDSALCPITPPTITGPNPPKVGDQLTFGGGSFDLSGSGFTSRSIQWLRCVEEDCQPIDDAVVNAPGSVYTVTARDVGTTIRVDEEISNADSSALNTSDPTGVVTLTPQTHPNGRIFWVTKLEPGSTFRIDSEFADGSGRQFLTTAVNPGWSTMPAASPDGTLVAFVNFGESNHVEVMNADGSAVTDLGVVGNYPTWSPGGNRIAFVSSQGIESIDDEGNDVLLWPLAAGTISGPIDWSPDGSKIAISYRAPGHTDADIAVVPADGPGAITLLTASTADEHDPSWSPLGDKIAFLRSSAAGSLNDGDLYEMNADGTGETLLYHGDPSHIAAFGTDWSPDGTKILFSILSNGTSELDTVSSACCSGPTQLPGDGYQNSLVSWAPAASYTLTVVKGGTGAGTVTSSPAGISCGGTCAATYADAKIVSLTATPAPGSTFTGWTGSLCSGTGTCSLTMLNDRAVTATFSAAAQAGGGGGGGGSSALTVSISPPSQTVASGASASWAISVTNAGGAYLYAVGASGSGAPGCGIPSSFADTAALMAPGVTISYTCSLANVTTSLTNSVVATATTGPGDVIKATATAAVTVQAPPPQASPAPTPPPPVRSASTAHAFTGTSRADRLTGTSGADVIRGLGGNDVLNGGKGNDKIFGGAGNDKLTGGAGNDKLYGDAGNDTIYARDGNRDVVDCAGGHDVVYADKRDTVARNCEIIVRP